jgi:predicted MFS family arabinose efflux permease
LATAGLGCVIFAAISGEYQGWGTWWVVLLFVIGGVCLAGFVPYEKRAATPMLDPRFVSTPIVRSALFAAFAVYLGVFAIFFLTALYLDIGLHYSGWRLAGMFAPMAAAIVLGGLATGPWVGRVGSRPPMVVGCGLAAAGMLLARHELGAGPHLTFALLALALALAGLGFGITVVPLTSAVLSHIPARHSGVAASATNTARQLGAVVGVTVLGAIVNEKLTATVDSYAPFKLLGPGVKDSVLHILETGGHAGSFSLDDIPPVFVRSFLDGVQLGMIVATGLIVLAGVVAALVREPPIDVEADEEAPVPSRVL